MSYNTILSTKYLHIIHIIVVSISYRVTRIDSVSYHAHVSERNLFGDLFEVLVDRDVATLEGSLRALMEDILSYLAPPTITLETKGTYYVAGVHLR